MNLVKVTTNKGRQKIVEGKFLPFGGRGLIYRLARALIMWEPHPLQLDTKY